MLWGILSQFGNSSIHTENSIREARKDSTARNPELEIGINNFKIQVSADACITLDDRILEDVIVGSSGSPTMKRERKSFPNSGKPLCYIQGNPWKCSKPKRDIDQEAGSTS